VRFSVLLGISLAFFTVSERASAEEPNAGFGFFTGTSVLVAGFGIGGVLLATSGARYKQDNAGWLAIESGFALAPVAAHGVTGEWVRGLAFAATPAAMTVGSGTVFAVDPHAVRHGQLTEQRILWSLFSVALFSGAVGVVDAAFADTRAKGITVSPSVGAGSFGLDVGGTL
jgi:hypothetical protein